MPSRKELELRARVVGIDPSTYVNDSQLEQRVISVEYNAATAAGTLATGTLTSDTTNNADGDVITVGPITYTYKTALTEVAASQTLTSNNTQVSEGDTVNVNGLVYTFRATPVKPYDVHFVTNADTSLTNLLNAVTLVGTPGTDYGTGTVVHPNVTVTGPSSHILTFKAKTAGVNGNRFTLQASAATLTTGGDFFTGGVDPVANQILIGASASVALDNTKSAINATTGAGTTYSSSTAINPAASAGTKTASTLAFTALAAANDVSIPTTKTAAHLSWGAATLTGNVAAVVAKSAYASTGATGGALV